MSLSVLHWANAGVARSQPNNRAAPALATTLERKFITLPPFERRTVDPAGVL
jgi:hypothetical protein